MHMEKSFHWSRWRRGIFPRPGRANGALLQIGRASLTVIPDATDCADSAAIPYAWRFGNIAMTVAPPALAALARAPVVRTDAK